MPKKTIAIVPEYAKTDNFSKISIMWLNYVSNGNNIKHVLNGGEKELTISNKTYKVDGFCKKKQYSIQILWLLLAWMSKLLQTQYHKQ